MIANTSRIERLLQGPPSLERASKASIDWLSQHPETYKVVIVVGQLIRMGIMAGFISSLPYSYGVNCAIAFAGSFFYRIPIEGICPFKFAIPSCFGAISFHLAQNGVELITKQVAFNSLESFVLTTASIAPLFLYGAYIIAITHYDMQHYLAKRKEGQSCCS